MNEQQKLKSWGRSKSIKLWTKRYVIRKSHQTTEWVVQIGILKMKLDESDLEYVKPEKEKQTVSMTNVKKESVM